MVTKGFKKKKSKRISSKTTRKVDKKVREHNRKKRKEARKNPTKNKAKKDPGVPNSLPFKDEILAEMVAKKRKDFEDKKQKKLDKKSNSTKKRTLEGLVKDAEKRGAGFVEAEVLPEGDRELSGLYDGSLKAYYREVKKVIEASDVILEVLDARDPLGTRCAQLEQNILQSQPRKRLVLVLNKCDLIPKENLLAWLKYFRQEFPTIAFKASTQNQKTLLSHSRVPIHLCKPDLIKSTKCFGANVLMKLLGNYCRNSGITTAIRVGIVGFPNVGKSSVINSLKRKQSCGVGATPGITKTMQEIHLDKHVTLLDSPGVIFTKEGSDAMAVLRNAIRVDTIADPVLPVDVILRKCSKTQLMVYYKLPDFKDLDEFLALVAAKRGLLKKGGIPDVIKAARQILQDWTSGKISYYMTPPETRPEDIHLDAQLVAEMSKEFDINGILEDEQMFIDEMPQVDSSRSSGVDGLDETVEDEPMVDDDKSVDDGKATRMVVNLDPLTKTAESEDEWLSDDSQKLLEGNQQLNKKTKKILKRRQKLKTRRDKTATSVAKKMGAVLSITGESNAVEMDE